MASPWDFNDPYDCQLEVINNIDDLNQSDQWLEGKLMEYRLTVSLGGRNDMPHIPLYKMKKEKNKLVEETLCSNELIQNYKQFKELCK